MVRWWTFPALVAIGFIVLVAANLSGSSIALLADRPSTSGLVAGTPRGIRSDEFVLRTPLAISSARQGFPAELWIGLTRTEQAAAAHGGPTLEWTTLLKPQDWGYILLGPSRGLAYSWWWSFAISLVGVYALIAQVTRRPITAAALSIAATFTPYAAWWTAPPAALFLGYATLGGAVVLAAMAARTRRASAGLGVFAGFVAAAFALALYPPWQVSLAWVVGAVTIGVALDRRVPLGRFVTIGGLAVLVGGALTTAWFLRHREAIAAIVGTIYPGQRVYHAGAASAAILVDAPLNFWLTGKAGATLGAGGVGGPYANLSESSSTWLALPLIGLLSLGTALIVARRPRTGASAATTHDAAGEATKAVQPQTWTLGLTSVATLLLLAWSLLPLPDIFGVVTFLQRVEPTRTGVALGLGQIVLIAAASRVVSRPPVWRLPWLIAASAVTVALTVWASTALPWDARLVPLALVIVSGGALALLLALAAAPRSATWGATLLAVYAFTSWALVNPVQRGIGPLLNDPLPMTMHDLASTPDGNDRVVVFAGYEVVAKVRAAGLESISGTTLYPDPELMSRLVPGQPELWNSYEQYRWRPAPAGAAARIVQVKGTAVDLFIDPCDPILLASVAPGWVVSETPLDSDCLTPVTVVAGRGATRFQIYRYQR